MTSERSPSSAPTVVSRSFCAAASHPVVFLTSCSFLLTGIGEAAAIYLNAPRIAVAGIAWYGLTLLISLAAGGWRAMMPGLLLVLPLITMEVGFGNTERTLSADKVALAVIASAWVAQRAPRALRRLARRPVVRGWAAFLGIAALSSIGQGLGSAQVWGLLRDAAYATVFLVALDQFDEPETRRSALELGGLAAGFAAAISVLEWALRLGGHPVVFYFKHGTMADEPAAGGTIGHLNFLAAYLVLFSPILAALWLANRGRRRLLGSVPLILGALALLYARSMGAWLGLAAGAGLFAWFAASDPIEARVKRSIVPGVLIIVMLTAAVVAVKASYSPASFTVRIAAYRIGLAAIKDRPLLGHGSGGFAREYQHYEQLVYGRPLREFRLRGAKLSAHSSFLDVAVDRGILGLAAFAALLGAIVVPALRACARARAGAERILLAGVIAGVSGFVIQAFTENLFDFSKIAAIFWIIAAALVRLTEVQPERPMA